MDQLTFGQLIKRARHERGLTGHDLSDLLGIDAGTLSRMESDKQTHPPAPYVLDQLSQHLRLPQADMLRALGYLQASTAPPPEVPPAALRIEAVALVLQLPEEQLANSIKSLQRLRNAVSARPSPRPAPPPARSSVGAGQLGR
jgi:transcriptional regulator with XRE-family HTH domain